MPSIFNVIDQAIKDALGSSALDRTVTGAPNCVVVASDIPVFSQDIDAAGKQFIVKGVLDSLVRLPDGKFAVIDYKTSMALNVERSYALQLDAYVYALRHPAQTNGPYKPTMISSESGLVIYEPASMKASGTGLGALIGVLSWKNIDYDEERFLRRLAEVGSLLASPRPAPGKYCDVCRYFDQRLRGT